MREVDPVEALGTMVEDHDPQLIHQHRRSQIGQQMMRHTLVVSYVVRNLLGHGDHRRRSDKRAVQRQLLPPSDHAL